MTQQKKSIFHWNYIKALPKNRLIKSSYFWFVIIPIIAKILRKIETPLAINVNKNQNLILDLSLPFSWKLFFLSSLAVVVGNILYNLFCPRLIKEFNNYSEFKKTGRNSLSLLSYIPIRDATLNKQFEGKYKDIELQQDNWIDNETYVSELDKSLKINFWDLYNRLNKSTPMIRVITYIFYLIGVLLFVTVIIQNVIYTIEQII